MAEIAISPLPRSEQLLARSRRFLRWLTTPRVFLSLIMLVVLFYFVIVPLYKMVATTITYQEKDVFRVPPGHFMNPLVGGFDLTGQRDDV